MGPFRGLGDCKMAEREITVLACGSYNSATDVTPPLVRRVAPSMIVPSAMQYGINCSDYIF